MNQPAIVNSARHHYKCSSFTCKPARHCQIGPPSLQMHLIFFLLSSPPSIKMHFILSYKPASLCQIGPLSLQMHSNFCLWTNPPLLTQPAIITNALYSFLYASPLLLYLPTIIRNAFHFFLWTIPPLLTQLATAQFGPRYKPWHSVLYGPKPGCNLGLFRFPY